MIQVIHQRQIRPQDVRWNRVQGKLQAASSTRHGRGTDTAQHRHDTSPALGLKAKPPKEGDWSPGRMVYTLLRTVGTIPSI